MTTGFKSKAGLSRLGSSGSLFLFLLAASLPVWWGPLSATLRLSFAHEEYTHILLVLPFTAGLLYIENRRWREGLRDGIWPGVALLSAALLLLILTHVRAFSLPADAQLAWSMLALVLWWLGSIVLCFEGGLVRVSWLSLGLLFFVIPLPETVLGRLIEFLQYRSADSAQLMFQAIGTPVTQDGVLLSLPGLNLEVARECSSIRSSMVLAVTTIVLAQVLLRSWWRRALLLLAVIPLSFIKNGLRIFVLSEISRRIDPNIFDSGWHHQGGSIFLGVALAAMIGLVWWLRRSEARGFEAKA